MSRSYHIMIGIGLTVAVYFAYDFHLSQHAVSAQRAAEAERLQTARARAVAEDQMRRAEAARLALNAEKAQQDILAARKRLQAAAAVAEASRAPRGEVQETARAPVAPKPTPQETQAHHDLQPLLQALERNPEAVLETAQREAEKALNQVLKDNQIDLNDTAIQLLESLTR